MVGIIQPVRGLNKTKMEKGRDQSLLSCLSWDISLLLALDLDSHDQLPWFPRSLDLDWNYTTRFPGLQLVNADHGTSQSP